MQNYPDKSKIVNWNSFDVTCKSERAIFTLLLTSQVLYFSDTFYAFGWLCLDEQDNSLPVFNFKRFNRISCLHYEMQLTLIKTFPAGSLGNFTPEHFLRNYVALIISLL